MRAVSGVVAALMIAAALTACSPKAADGEKTAAAESAAPALLPTAVPKPKQGKWKMTMAIPGLPKPNTVEFCYTQAMLDEMKSMADNLKGVDCGEPAISRDGPAYVTRVSCTTQGQQSTTTIRTEGDFNSRYTSEMTTVSTPAAPGDNTPIKTVAEYVGPC